MKKHKATLSQSQLSKAKLKKEIHRDVDQRIFQLALPSLATLLVEPLLIAIDSAMVGRLGTNALAGLALASTILTTVVGLCIFLTYATTAATARAIGNGNQSKALRLGIDGIWLAGGIGIILALALHFFATPLLQLFEPKTGVLLQAIQYLQASIFGLPGMLIVLAATGALRGFANTKAPLIASTAGALLNIPLNIALIYGANLGIAGAGYGTAIAQSGMAFYLAGIVFHAAYTQPQTQAADTRNPLLPSGIGVLKSLRAAVPLIIRNVALRAALLLQIAAATSLGTIALASNQIIISFWNFASYGLDSLAIAAQILIGQSLGAGDQIKVQLILTRCLRWGARAGAVLGGVFFLCALFVPQLMSDDVSVQTLSRFTIYFVALTLPISAIAYLLDGVLIGAGDTEKLAKYMIFALGAFVPFSLPLIFWGENLAQYFSQIIAGSLPLGSICGMLLLWFGYAVIFMGIRAISMYRRSRTSAWMHLAPTQN